MAQVTYLIKDGDTLSEIAVKHNTTVDALLKLNPKITNKDLIYAGDTIVISGDPATVAQNNTYKATITAFGRQANSTNLLFATWSWDQEKTKSYQVRWMFKAGDKWFYGDTSDKPINEIDPNSSKCSTYTIPNNAEAVTFEVKPICDGSSWKASWSTKKTYYFVAIPNGQLTTKLDDKDKTKLKIELSNITTVADKIEFQVVKNNTTVFIKSIVANVNTTTQYASTTCKLDLGGEYKVRCRAKKGKSYSDWSGYSSIVYTAPLAPSSFKTCKATSETSVYLKWAEVKTATGYTIQYTTEKDDFELNSDELKEKTVTGFNYCELTGLTTGKEYFFRVKALNSGGESKWTNVVSVLLGDEPAAPTTWSSTTTVISGEPLKLYWVHNATDSSSQTYAELRIYQDKLQKVDVTIQYSNGKTTITGTGKGYILSTNIKEEDEENQTNYCEIDTSTFSEGASIRWQVRTAGVTKTFGDWSTDRYIDIFDDPKLEFSVSNSSGDAIIDTVESFPLLVSGYIASTIQHPIGYHLSIKSNDVYETVDSVGNVKMVNKGEEIYSKHFDISTPLSVELSANDLDLENNITYTITCLVALDSGLTAESSLDFTVAWTDTLCWPNAMVEVDTDTYVAYVSPFCSDIKGKMIKDVLLSVYRREVDGTFTELAKDLENTGGTAIVDPHPSLDYARYRIVAKTTDTGAISYYDIPAQAIGGKAIIIQWNESTSDFDISADENPADSPWSGSMLKLPYNIDVSNNYKPDVSFVEYIGREQPVSYYGTHLGESATWNTVIPKSDTETLYYLRRLARWMGNVYVREPSGSGYWANVTVSFSQKHLDVTIPVTLSVTRVEGGA